MENLTAMTDKQANALLEARTQQAKVIVHLAANPNNPIVQAFGGLVLKVANRAVAKLEAKQAAL